MNRYVRLSGVLILAASALLAGCSDDPEPPHAPGGIALVVGGRSNMPLPVLAGRARNEVDKAFRSKDTLFIVGVSGSPKLLYTEKIKNGCDSDRACDAAADTYLGKIDKLLTRVVADSPEADQLAAIATATDHLRGLTDDGPRQILVIDNGLQTTGDMPLQTPGALAVDPDEQAAALLKTQALPSLDGVDVLMAGLGAGFLPQPDLGRPVQQQVQKLWQTVLTKAGAEVTVLPNELNDDLAPAAGQPKVTPVVVEEKPQRQGNCYRVRDDQVGFLPGKDVLRDEAAAREVLTPIAADLKNQKVAVSVIGTTALPEDPPFPLSTKRAERVSGLLADLGVSPSSMIVGGVGTGFTDFKPDTRPDGSLIPSLAMQNRLVMINPVGKSC